jgi:Transposase zinc-binding domain
MRSTACATPENPALHQRHRPEETTLYRVVQAHLNTFLSFVDIETGGVGLPTFVTDEFDAFLECGILAHGFLRLRCDGCKEEKLVAFSCPPRGLPKGRNVAASAPRAARGAWPRPPPIWLTTSSRQCRYANGCCHSQFPSAVCLPSIRMRWAQLLKRVFDIDIEHCPHCGGQLKLIAAIEEPAAIERILTHLGWPCSRYRVHRRYGWSCLKQREGQHQTGF